MLWASVDSSRGSQIFPGVGKLERLRHDADDGSRLAADHQLPPDHGRVRAIPVPPHAFVDHHHALGARVTIGRDQRAAGERRGLEPRHRARCEIRALDGFDFAGTARNRERPDTDGADMLEAHGAIADRLILLDAGLYRIALTAEYIDASEAVSCLIRQPAVNELFAEREAHGRQADAGCQSQDDRDGKDGLLGDQPHAEADLGPRNDSVHPCWLRIGTSARSRRTREAGAFQRAT